MYWLILVIFFGIISGLILNGGAIKLGDFSEIAILSVFFVLICLPLVTEIEIFGVKFKKEIIEIKDNIENLRNTILNQLNYSPIINIGTPVQEVNKSTDLTLLDLQSVVITSDNVNYSWYAKNGLRYIFPSAEVFDSWFRRGDPIKVYKLKNETISKIFIGGNVTMKPGARVLRFAHDKNFYAVDQPRTLRQFANEEVLEGIYGKGWRYLIAHLPEWQFVNYDIGKPIGTLQDFDINITHNLKTPDDLLEGSLPSLVSKS